MALNREPVQGNTALQSKPILIVGPPGIGKSTFCASAYPKERMFFLDCDITESLVSYTLPKARCDNWASFSSYVKEFLQDDHFQWLCIDTLNGAYSLCMTQVCLEKNISNPGELNDYGATWSAIADRFMRPLLAIQRSGKGLLCTAHASVTEVMIGNKRYNRWIPSFTGSSVQSAYARVEAFFPIIGFMNRESQPAPPEKIVTSKKGGTKSIVDMKKDIGDLAGQQRVIYFQPGENWVAKDRTGRLPDMLALPEDWSEDWAEFEKMYSEDQKGEEGNGD